MRPVPRKEERRGRCFQQGNRQSRGRHTVAPSVGLGSVSQPEATLGHTKAKQQELGPCP